MKTPKKFLLLCSVVMCTTALVSWNRLNYSTKELNTCRWSYLHETNSQDLTDAEMNALITGDDGFSPEAGKAAPPPAEDVLIQKIPGDINHVLMMAFYSKENYSGPSFSLENGGHLVFRDDGNGYDKIAGDGLYTARAVVDLNEFRQKAVSVTAQMKKTGYRPIRFDNRAMIVNPDADENFDMQKWENGETVSISGLTNALADLGLSNGVLSGSATNTVLSNNSASTVSIDASVVDDIRANCVTITNLAVVEDPTRTWNSCTQKGNINGPWTFKTIMRELASKDPVNKATDAQISAFVKNWLSNWASNRTVNGDVVAARTLVNTRILNPWLSKSQNGGAPAGQLDMRFAPFKLLAIVNRFDLRAGGLHGIPNGPGSAVGEGRYVFGLINSTCSGALKMGVILEYGVNKPNTCDARKAWAQQWVNLRTLTIGSSAYNQALQNITNQYTLCGSSPARPNQSSLDQLRTNEQTLSSASPGVWEMREFVLDPGGSGFLKQSTVAQNPADKYDAQVNNAEVVRMAQFVNQNTSAIRGDAFTVPLTWQGFPFLGGAAKLIIPSTGQVAKPTGAISAPNPFHWDGTTSSADPTFIKNDGARFNFSLNTCWGCHGGETQTGFTHIDPVFFGREATLSGFLTGVAGTGNAIDFDNDPTNALMAVKDPALRPLGGTPKIRVFNDIQRRARDLNAVVSTTCGTVLSISSDLLFKPLNSVD